MNILLSNNAKFRPYTFDEMLKPLSMATAAYNELQDNASELADKAELMRIYANEDPNSKAATMYNNYVRNLEEQADSLSRYGLTPKSRQKVLDLKNLYNSTIVPIETAVNTRKEQDKVQAAALLQDPTIMFSRRASTTGLDAYIDNPNLSYDVASGKLITAQVAAAASNLAKQVRENPRKWRSILGNSYYETIIRKGYSDEAILEAIQNNQNASPVLQQIMEDAVNASRVKDWGDNNIVNDAYRYAGMGLWNAIGETTYKELENWRARLAATNAQKSDSLEKPALNPINMYSARKRSQAAKDIAKYSKYFSIDRDGILRLNEEGVKEYNRTLWNAQPYAVHPQFGTPTQTPGTSSGYTDSRSDFRKVMDRINEGDPIDLPSDPAEAGTIMGLQTEYGRRAELGRIWNAYVEANKEDLYDAHKETGFKTVFDSADKEDVQRAITAVLGNKDLEEVDYDAETGSVIKVPGGRKISKKDLMKGNANVVGTVISPFGHMLLIQDEDGEVVSFELPSGINPTNEKNRDLALAKARMLQQNINNGTFVDAQGNVIEATDAEIAQMQLAYEAAIRAADLYESQLWYSSRTENKKNKPVGY